MVDRFVDLLLARSLRRAWRGQPVWLAVGAAAWLVRRSRRNDRALLWSGTVAEGQRLVVTTSGSGDVRPGRLRQRTTGPGDAGSS